jgi:chemotaxis protein methyltransferase CheR
LTPSPISEKISQAQTQLRAVPQIETTPTPARSYKQEVNTYKVLCVDDSPTIHALMKRIFSEDVACRGIEIANNGREARQKLDQGKYDIITLDIHMPEVSGIQFLETLYKKDSDPPVVMVSSVTRSDIDLATKSLSLGASDYVEKPAMNNLKKSADEILTKAKMAMRNRALKANDSNSAFDTSISQKIIVPDASQCLRIIVTSDKSLPQLKQVILGQEKEYRSPATIVLADTLNAALNFESELLAISQKGVQRIRDAKQHYKPNAIYFSGIDLAPSIFEKLRVSNCSLQILCEGFYDFSQLKQVGNLQVLLDENVGDIFNLFEKNTQLKISDMTPATSFPSLSVEYFANVRKAAA